MSEAQKPGRASKDELLDALEAMDDTDDGEGWENEAGLSEAERLAAHADAPLRRGDGKPKGADAYTRPKPLTASQMEFTKGLITGKTMRQAYRDAYPNAKGNDQVITSSAYRLSQDKRIQATLQEAWGETVEVLAEDTAATKRYVLKELLALSKGGKQEGSRLKALELMGRAAGMFQPQVEAPTEKLSAEQLRKELSGHLKLLDNVKPITTAKLKAG
jgi:hypothetical protein